VPVKYNSEELKELLISNKIDVVTFTSASTVKNFVKSLGKHAELLNKVLIASIGPVTSEAAIKLGLRVDVEAKEQTIAGLVEAIINYYSEVHK
jgi:uroporphyrinogen III methyltransferase/synthase